MQLFINHTIRYEDVLCSSVKMHSFTHYNFVCISATIYIYTTIALELRYMSGSGMERTLLLTILKSYLS
jgi:hypothetical protein